MDIEIKYKFPKVSEEDSILHTLILYELNSAFNKEKYPPLQPNDIITTAVLHTIRNVVATQILIKRLEIEYKINEALELAQKKFPQFTIEKIKELIGGINIKFVEDNTE